MATISFYHIHNWELYNLIRTGEIKELDMFDNLNDASPICKEKFHNEFEKLKNDFNYFLNHAKELIESSFSEEPHFDLDSYKKSLWKSLPNELAQLAAKEHIVYADAVFQRSQHINSKTSRRINDLTPLNGYSTISFDGRRFEQDIFEEIDYTYSATFGNAFFDISPKFYPEIFIDSRENVLQYQRHIDYSNEWRAISDINWENNNFKVPELLQTKFDGSRIRFLLGEYDYFANKIIIYDNRINFLTERIERIGLNISRSEIIEGAILTGVGYWISQNIAQIPQIISSEILPWSNLWAGLFYDRFITRIVNCSRSNHYDLMNLFFNKSFGLIERSEFSTLGNESFVDHSVFFNQLPNFRTIEDVSNFGRKFQTIKEASRQLGLRVAYGAILEYAGMDSQLTKWNEC